MSQFLLTLGLYSYYNTLYMAGAEPTTIDEYIANYPENVQKNYYFPKRPKKQRPFLS